MRVCIGNKMIIIKAVDMRGFGLEGYAFTRRNIRRSDEKSSGEKKLNKTIDKERLYDDMKENYNDQKYFN